MIEIRIIILKEAQDFLDALPLNVRKKIAKVFERVCSGEKNKEIFKKLEGDLWEFRISYNDTVYRLLAFWDKNSRSLIVVTNAFVKKTDKTPKDKKELAKQIMVKWYNAH